MKLGDYLDRYPKLSWLISITFGLAPILLLDAYAPVWSSYAYLGALISLGTVVSVLSNQR